MSRTTKQEKFVIVDTGQPHDRIVLEEWSDSHGPTRMKVASQHQRRNGSWHSAVSGLLLTPEAARALAPGLTAMAAMIDAAPVDPEPTEQDREESRMP